MTDFQVSPKFRRSNWDMIAFVAETDWQRAIDIVENRLSGRFLDWVNRVKDEQYSGFVVVAIDCMFLEALYGFMEGQTTRDTKSVYKKMLALFGFDETTAMLFYDNIRNGIFHDGETRNQWLIEKTIPKDKIFDKDLSGKMTLNRTLFDERLNKEFRAWLKGLRDGNADSRTKMRKRMDDVIKRHEVFGG